MNNAIWLVGLIFLVFGLMGAWYTSEQRRYGAAGVFVILCVVGMVMVVLSSLEMMSP